jgi:multidrug resistance efflux pump
LQAKPAFQLTGQDRERLNDLQQQLEAAQQQLQQAQQVAAAAQRRAELVAAGVVSEPAVVNA